PSAAPAAASGGLTAQGSAPPAAASAQRPVVGHRASAGRDAVAARAEVQPEQARAGRQPGAATAAGADAEPAAAGGQAHSLTPSRLSISARSRPSRRRSSVISLTITDGESRSGGVWPAPAR